MGDKVRRVHCSAIPEAPSHGKTIFEYRPGSCGAEDFEALTKELERRT